MFVCLFSVCWRISKTRPNFTKFSVHVTCGHDTVVLLCHQCNMLCTSGFCGRRHVFYIMEGVGQNQRRCSRFIQCASWRHQDDVCHLRLHLLWWMQTQRHVAANRQSKPTDLGIESPCRLLPSTSTITIYHLSLKMILTLPSYGRWKAKSIWALQ